MKHKVLLVGPNRNIVGGVATHINILRKSLEKVNIETDIYELKDYSDGNLILRKLRDIKKIFNIQSNISDQYTAIHLNPSIYQGSFIKLILTLTRLRHKNIIVQFHGGDFENISKINNKMLIHFFTKVLKKASCFIFLSTDQRDGFLNLFPAFKEKSLVLPNFIDIAEGSPKEKVNQKLSVLFLARLVKEKGVIELIKAVEMLDNNDISVNIIGEGPCESEIVALIKERNLEKKVQFLGPKFGKEKEDYLENADIYILPSSWKEGVPYTILEAMKYRAAVLCTPQGGLKDIITDGHNGIFIKRDVENIKNNLKDLLENRSVVNQVSENAYQYLKDNLSVDKAGETFKNIYLDNSAS